MHIFHDSTGEKYKSHRKMIDFDEAKNVLKLNVEKIDPNSALWTDIWELYCRSIHYLHVGQQTGAAKLFESDSISLTMSIQAVVVQAPRPPPPLPRQLPPTPPAPPSRQPPPTPQQPSD
jgi:hypothetical protein